MLHLSRAKFVVSYRWIRWCGNVDNIYLVNGIQCPVWLEVTLSESLSYSLLKWKLWCLLTRPRSLLLSELNSLVINGRGWGSPAVAIVQLLLLLVSVRYGLAKLVDLVASIAVALWWCLLCARPTQLHITWCTSVQKSLLSILAVFINICAKDVKMAPIFVLSWLTDTS